MGKNVVSSIIGKGTIGAGITAAGAAITNAIGPSSAVDPGMHYYERAAAMANWHPTNPITSALVGAGIGTAVGIISRHHEWKKQQAELHGEKMGRQFS